MKRIKIAIDGLSSCGKSTFARAIAQQLGYIYVDTGAMYRAITLAAIRDGLGDMAGLGHAAILSFLERHTLCYRAGGMQGWQQYGNEGGCGERNPMADSAGRANPQLELDGVLLDHELRMPEVANLVSQVAAVPEVRTHLVAIQQEIGRGGGVAMDGRDVGTVIFPDAELKIFMTARPEVRAKRRYDEMVAKGLPANYDEIYANLIQRDRIDTTRACNPMRRAEDALELDNSEMTIDEQLAWVMPIAEAKIRGEA